MGCLQSKTSHVQSPEEESVQAEEKPDLGNGVPTENDLQVPAFKEYGLLELRKR